MASPMAIATQAAAGGSGGSRHPPGGGRQPSKGSRRFCPRCQLPDHDGPCVKVKCRICGKKHFGPCDRRCERCHRRGHRTDECWNEEVHTVIGMQQITDRDEAFRIRAAMPQGHLPLFGVELDELGENTLRNRAKRQKRISRKNAARARRAEGGINISSSVPVGPSPADTVASHTSAATDDEEQAAEVTALADLQLRAQTYIEADWEPKDIPYRPKGK